ncbi:MAG: FAD-binding oxidoreductase [Alphaproteobacteria bacterium]|nr:FAD-binding oxidoreductase [Alphaproteobacteria bacterium]
MSHRHTRKRHRDRAAIARWRTYDDGLFKRIGISRDALEKAQWGFRGSILFPGEPGYSPGTLLSNARFDPQPSVIFMCEVENDVRIALNMAGGGPATVPFTVLSGGHCTAGFSATDGILIDVSKLNSVTVDPTSMTAVIGTGCNFATLYAALDEYGLHVPGGECDEVCVGGYMQGGGQGFTSRTFGMHCDNVIEVRVMLADGSIVTANAQQNYDLWWAVRGGTGGNFGVLLTEEVQLRPLGQVYGWAVRWPLTEESDRANAAAALYMLQQQYMLTAPPELNPQVMICYQSETGPGSPFVPYLMIRGLDTRGKAVGEAVYQAFGALAGAEMQYDLVDGFTVVNKTLLESPNEIPQLPTEIWPPEDKQARYVSMSLTQPQWQSLLDFYITAPNQPNQYSYICLELYGGAMNSYPIEDSAFIHRTSAFSAFMDVFWYGNEQQPLAEAFLDSWCSFMNNFANGEIYQNYPSLNVPDYRTSYWGQAFSGLLAAKQKYDPQNFFAFPQMISPYPDGRATGAIWPPKLAEALKKPIERSGPQRVRR